MQGSGATTTRWVWSTAAVAGLVTAGGLAVALGASRPASPRAQVVISEVSSDGDDRIELYNAGTTTAHLAGWSVVDSDPAHAPYELARGTTLGAGEYLVLVRGQAHAFGLGEADGLMLRDADGNTVDATSWPAGSASPSWCRAADSGEMVTCTSATFGGRNPGLTSLAALD